MLTEAEWMAVYNNVTSLGLAEPALIDGSLINLYCSVLKSLGFKTKGFYFAEPVELINLNLITALYGNKRGLQGLLIQQEFDNQPLSVGYTPDKAKLIFAVPQLVNFQVTPKEVINLSLHESVRIPRRVKRRVMVLQKSLYNLDKVTKKLDPTTDVEFDGSISFIADYAFEVLDADGFAKGLELSTDFALWIKDYLTEAALKLLSF